MWPSYMPLSKVPRFCCIGAALFFNHSFYQGCVCFALNVSMASCTEQREERTLETPQYCCCVCIFLPLLHALRAAAASLLSGQHKALSDLAGHVCIWVITACVQWTQGEGGKVKVHRWRWVIRVRGCVVCTSSEGLRFSTICLETSNILSLPA